MIAGIGVDIVNIKRIEKIFQKFGARFVNKILSKEEISQLSELKIELYPKFLAKRFAAKEAVAKALGSGIGKIGFKDIVILNDKMGKPSARIINCRDDIEISISDEDPYAIGFAIIQTKSV